MDVSTPREQAITGAVLVAAFALRAYRLGAASLWYDETVSVILAQKDVLALTRHTAGDIHPPLYYYLLHLWGRLAGWSEFSVAFVSLFFGVLLVALVYRVAREWFDARVARRAALLVALSPYNLWYSQEVRMYTLGACLGLVSTYLFVRMLTADRRRLTTDRRPATAAWVLVAYVTVSALGVYTLYYFAFLLAFQNLAALVWLIRNRKELCNLYRWLVSQVAILVLYAPWLPIAFRQATDPPVPPWRSFTALPDVLLESFATLAFGQSIEPMLVAPMLVVIAGVIAFALWHHRRPLSADRPTDSLSHCPLFLLGYTLVPLFIIYALSLWKPLYHVRYIFTYSPAFYILVAQGFVQVSHYATRKAQGTRRITKRIVTILACLLLATYVILLAFSTYNFWYSPRYAKDDLRGAVRYLSEHWRPGDAILINAGYTYPAFLYYADVPIAWRGRLTQYALRNTNEGAIVLQTGSIGGAPNLGWGNPESDFYATTADETRAALDRVFAAHPRLWMLRLYDTVVDPNGIIRDYLATRGRLFDDEGFVGNSYARVQGYLTTRAPLTTLPNDVIRRDVLLGKRIVLLGFTPNATRVRVGAPLDVEVYWQAREPTNVDARLYIGLFAEDGNVVAAADEIPIGNALGTSRWMPGEILRQPIRLRIPPHLAPGEYVLRIALYNPLTNETLAPAPQEFVTENGHIVLTRVQVNPASEN